MLRISHNNPNCPSDEGRIYETLNNIYLSNQKESIEVMRINKRLYSVYILTNFNKTVLYTGVTNDLEQRIIEHYLNSNKPKSFTGKYKTFYLLYYEDYKYINEAIAREKEIKGWKRIKKEELIKLLNPEMNFLNIELFGKWPPDNMFSRSEDQYCHFNKEEWLKNRCFVTQHDNAD